MLPLTGYFAGCCTRRVDKVKKPCKDKSDSKWENGMNWEEAPSGGGDWVRVYPYISGSFKTLADTQANRQKEARSVVTDVAKAARIAKTISAR